MSPDTLSPYVFGVFVSLLGAYGFVTFGRKILSSRLVQDLQMAVGFFTFLRKAGPVPPQHRFHFATSAAIQWCKQMASANATVVSRIGTRIGF